MAQGGALVLPAGSVPKVILSGDEHDIKLLSYRVEDDWTACVQYPDGYVRQHRVFNLTELLDKISGQLKMRYNVTSFEFKAIPQGLGDRLVIRIGGIKYA